MDRKVNRAAFYIQFRCHCIRASAVFLSSELNSRDECNIIYIYFNIFEGSAFMEDINIDFLVFS